MELQLVPMHSLLADAAAQSCHPRHSGLVSAVRNFAPFRRRPEVIPDAIGQIGPRPRPPLLFLPLTTDMAETAAA